MIEITPKIKLKVDRSKWGRKKLLKEDGSMCMLGFLGRQIGIPDERLLNRAEPELIYPEDIRKWGEAGMLTCGRDGKPEVSWDASKIMSVNDSFLSEEDKEQLLLRHMRDIGIEVEFV